MYDKMNKKELFMNINKIDNNLYKSSLHSAIVGGVFGAVVQGASSLRFYAKNKDIIDFSFKNVASSTAKNAGYCALLSGILTFSFNYFSNIFRKKNEI